MTQVTRQILVLSLGMLLPSWALAQTTGSTTTTTSSTAGNGSCSGTVNGKTISGRTMLSLGGVPVELNTGPAGPQSVGCGASSDSIDIVQQNIGTAFGKAECQCHGRGLKMRVILDSPVASDGQPFNSSMYVGQDNCSDQTQRTTTGAQCEQISATNPPDNTIFSIKPESFRVAGSPVDIVLPAEALTKPRPVGTSPTGYEYVCDTGGPQNVTAQVLLGPDSSPATCKLPLVVNTAGPTAPKIESVGSGNGGLMVYWSVPESTSGILFYQLLCRNKKEPNTPVMSDDFLANTRHYFSACIDGVLYRRPYNADNTNTTEPHPGRGDKPAAGTFLVDPHFICSDRITAATTSSSARIAGLQNNETYEVMVVSIDAYGNASPSAVVEGVPLPTQGVLDKECSMSADCPTGFGCSGSGHRASPSAPLFAVAATVLLGLMRRLARRVR